MSLKSMLISRIHSRDGAVVTYQEIENLVRSINQAEDKHYKQSNFERRLRKSESPDIETVYNDKGHIIGYKSMKGSQRELFAV